MSWGREGKKKKTPSSKAREVYDSQEGKRENDGEGEPLSCLGLGTNSDTLKNIRPNGKSTPSK